jgi:hypothetical protein
VPLPASDTVWGLPVALSAMLSEPVRLPVVVGLKVTLMPQLDPGAREEPQLLVWVKSPVMVTPVMANAAEPLFVSVTVWEALATPTVSSGNCRLFEESVTAGACATPVPVRAICCGLPAALSVMVSSPA